MSVKNDDDLFGLSPWVLLGIAVGGVALVSYMSDTKQDAGAGRYVASLPAPQQEASRITDCRSTYCYRCTRDFAGGCTCVSTDNIGCNFPGISLIS